MMGKRRERRKMEKELSNGLVMRCIMEVTKTINVMVKES